MNLTWVENFLFGNFGKMPFPLRAFTYLVLLSLFVYRSLLPEFIDGEIRIKNEDGSYLHYTLGEVSMVVDGKTISTRLDENGRWSLPVMEKIPRDKTLSIAYTTRERDLANFDIILKKSYFLSDDLVVVYHNPDSDQKFYLADDDSSGLAGVFLDFLSPSTTYAAVSSDELERINRITEDITSENARNDSTNIFEKYNIDSKDEILLKQSIEKKQKISIPTRKWLTIKTADDLKKVIKSEQKKAQVKTESESGYVYYGIQHRDSSWGERYFNNDSRIAERRPQVGDIVTAKGKVNIRSGYIEFSFLHGWRNKEITGLVEPGDKLLVDEVKSVAGSYVWIKFRRVVE